MKFILWLTIALPMCIFTVMNYANAQSLSQYRWEKRPILIFADKETDSTYQKQMKRFNAGKAELVARDVVVLSDIKTATPGALRLKYSPNKFLLVLIGKDGGVKFRSQTPVSVEKIMEIIDVMPMRRREMREKS